MINIGLELRSAENQAEFLQNRKQKPTEPSENMYVSICSKYMVVHCIRSQLFFFLYNTNHLHLKFISWDLRNTGLDPHTILSTFPSMPA